jgi:hypothetical protein
VVEKNIAVDIHATGTKRHEQETVALPSPPQPLALPAPHPIVGERKSGNKRIGSKAVVLFYLAQHGRATNAQLRDALVKAGYKSSTINNLIWSMKDKGLVARSAQGYRILNKGLKKLDTPEEDY